MAKSHRPPNRSALQQSMSSAVMDNPSVASLQGTSSRNGGLDMKQLIFNNLQLLDFDAANMEAVHRIPFNKEMFDFANKKGAFIVLHFLFNRLNPTMSKEAFRDTWPIFDKKREQQFRKTCCTWLSNISTEESDSRLPRVNASLFLSPGGDKFYNLLLFFSSYVLQKVVISELGVKHVDMLKAPHLTNQNLQLASPIRKSVQCSAIRQRNEYFAVIQKHEKAARTWKKSTDGMVKDYRRIGKETREAEYKIREEEQKSTRASVARGSPVRSRGPVDQFDPQSDPRTIRRSQQIQMVREMWKNVEDFDKAMEAEREVLESILEKTINKYQLNCDQLNVQVPGMLLRVCQEEIRRRNVDNTYQGGKLNILSVLQLWNMALQLYRDKLKEGGVPKFEKEVENLTSQVHIQTNYAHNAQQLRNDMAQTIPARKIAVAELRRKLDHIHFHDQSTDSIRLTSIGLGLVEKTPQATFSPGSAVTPEGGLGVTDTPTARVSTMEAARQISREVRDKVRQKQPTQLFKDTNLVKRVESSSLPKPRSAASSRPSSRPSSAKSTTSSKGGTSTAKTTTTQVISNKSVKSKSKPSQSVHTNTSFPRVSSPLTMMEATSFTDFCGKDNTRDLSLPLSARSNTSTISDKTLTGASSNQSTPRSKGSRSSPRSQSSRSSAKVVQEPVLSPKSQSSRSSVKVVEESVMSPESQKSKSSPRSARSATFNYRLEERKTTVDLLVEEIMGEGKILSTLNSGLEAFESREFLRRTPDLVEPDTTLTPPNSEIQTELRSDTEDDMGHIVNIVGPDLDDIGGDIDGDIEQDNENKGGDRELDDRSNNDGDINEKNESDRADNGMEQELKTYGVDDIDELEANVEHEFGGFNDVNNRNEVEDDLEPEGDDENDNICGVNGVVNFGNNDESEDSNVDNDDDAESVRSTEELIVIDRSVHLSPQQVLDRSRDRESPVMLEDETFPSYDNSPREPIVIDRSFQYTPLHRNMSMEKDRLSQSLFVNNQSPLSEEIRKMFKQAVADTPPKPVPGRQFSSDDFLETPDMDPDSRCNLDSESDGPQYRCRLHGNTSNHDLYSEVKGQGHGNALKMSDISWEAAENLDDIQFPDMDLSDGDIMDFSSPGGQRLLDSESLSEAQRSINCERTPEGQGQRGEGDGVSQEANLMSFTPSAKVKKDVALIVFSPTL